MSDNIKIEPGKFNVTIGCVSGLLTSIIIVYMVSNPSKRRFVFTTFDYQILSFLYETSSKTPKHKASDLAKTFDHSGNIGLSKRIAYLRDRNCINIYMGTDGEVTVSLSQKGRYIYKRFLQFVDWKELFGVT